MKYAFEEPLTRRHCGAKTRKGTPCKRLRNATLCPLYPLTLTGRGSRKAFSETGGLFLLTYIRGIKAILFDVRFENISF